jgi:PAS domain S-box-containing protein
VFIDVTATKELENRLKSTQSRMQQLVDGIPGLFSYIDKEYKVWFMSSQYRDIFKREADDLVGVHIRDLIGEQMFAERKPRYDEALSGVEVHSESCRRMPDGTTAYFSVTHKPFRNEKGEILGVITLGIDVTERRKMEQHLEAKSEELQRSNKDLEQFAYVASHDLKAPLRAIEVIIEWLRDDLEEYTAGDVHENLDLLSQRTGRLARLLDDLLAYSRAGRKIGDVRTFDMREFVQDIAALLAPPEGFRIIADESLPTITAHHAPLETVLRNLISNAIKHHPDPQEGIVRVYAQDQGDSVMFSVEDNGEGIPEQYAERVFQMFQTLKPRDDTEGSGMGLAIVQRIVNWQKGKVWFTSGSDGKGTTFKFTWNKAPTDMPTIEKDESNERHQDETSKDLVG